MKKTFTALSLSALVAGCAHHRQSGMGATGTTPEMLTGTEIGTVAPEEARFARQACQSDVAQAEMANLAAKNTKNDSIRSFAQKLVRERSQAEHELSQIFAHKNLRAEPELAPDLQQALQRLDRLKGREFDRAFTQETIETNQRLIRSFEDQAQHGTDPDLKAFAARYLPELRSQLVMAEQLNILAAETPLKEPSDAAAINSVLRQQGVAPGPR